MLAEPELAAVVRANVERLSAEQGVAIVLDDPITLAGVERAAEALGVPVSALLI